MSRLCCHLVYLIYKQTTSWDMPGWMNHKLESRLPGETRKKVRNINNLRYANETILMAESGEEAKSLLMRVKEESEKAGLKLNIRKN